MKRKVYLVIDLKCFYASVECVERGLNPFTTNLVVADKTRGKGSICLAISPRLKELGVKNRCRLFEIPSDIEYICAKPRMQEYINKSADIYAIYLKYIAKEDILVYSIDECFLDISKYLSLYKKNEFELAKMIIDDVYKTTGICATVGIGTNMFLAKVALDIISKKSADHIGYLDEEIFKKEIWFHRPITDIWNIGRGIAKRLAKYDVYDLHGLSLLDEKILYKEFGINALHLIEHSKGIEPCTIKDVHNYKSKSNSLSNGQILFEDYDYSSAFLVVKEMIDLLLLDLREKHLVCKNVGLYIGYSKDTHSSSGGSTSFDGYTSSSKKIKEAFEKLYHKYTNKDYPIRKISLSLNDIKDESYEIIDLFYDYEEEKKDKKILDVMIEIKKKYGKNSIMKAMDLEEKATTIKRNKLIGGHNSE